MRDNDTYKRLDNIAYWSFSPLWITWRLLPKIPMALGMVLFFPSIVAVELFRWQDREYRDYPYLSVYAYIASILSVILQVALLVGFIALLISPWGGHTAIWEYLTADH